MSNSEIDRKLKVVSDGRMAEVAWQNFGSDLEKQRHDTIEVMKANYISGKNDPATLAGGVAAICALDALRDRILKKIKLSTAVDKENLHVPT